MKKVLLLVGFTVVSLFFFASDVFAADGFGESTTGRAGIGTSARVINPADGACGISPDVVLSWATEPNADSYDLYFGTSFNDVNDANTDSAEYMGSSDANSYYLGELEEDTTYYWRIDDVNLSDPCSPYKGGVWTFTTANVYYVDTQAGGNKDGSSWHDAFNHLQNALRVARRCDEIRVAEGIYKPDEDYVYPIGSGDRKATFRLKNGLAIYGGYAGYGEPDPNERDPNTYKTILSGDLKDNDGPDFANNGENSYHVVTSRGTDETAVLDGFIITAGNANGWDLDSYGGGMLNFESNPTLTNCTFIGNSAEYGGGMFSYNDSPPLTNCIFSDNSADYGGGMLNYNSNPPLTNCTFSDNSGDIGGGVLNVISNPGLTNCTFSGNSATWEGGGMCNLENSSPTLTNCTFTGNSVGDDSDDSGGGGMLNGYGSNPTLTNCAFIGNSAGYGGGMLNFDSSPTPTNCIFSGNSAMWDGGGMASWDLSSPTLTNCTFSNNSAEYYSGGGMFNLGQSNPTLTNCIFIGNSAGDGGGGMGNQDNSSPVITNCNFIGNSAGNAGGGMVNRESNPTLTNCILWDNTASSGAQIYNDGTSSTTVNYSCIQGYVEPNEPPTEGLISCWRFDEGSGSTAYDSVGENHGTLENEPIWTTGQIGGALSFDGFNDYVRIPDSDSLDITGDLTIGAWVKTSQTEAWSIIFSNLLQISPHDGYALEMTSWEEYNGNVRFYSQESYLFSIGRINTGTWKHVAVTLSGTTATIYIDGVFDNSGTVNVPNTNGVDQTIGASYSPYYLFGGIIDDVRIYDRALSTEEIEQLYQYGLGGQGNIGADPCFVAPGYWDANGLWVDWDYHLLPGSPCINAGDPSYVAGPNETDLDGLPRVISGRIDMGCYEFRPNNQPVAIAGPNQIAYAWIDGFADVNLDGSGSYDADNDMLDYYWSWTIDGNDYEASGIAPIIELPIGKHEIELVVDDGIDLSEPNHCTVTVIEPLQARLFCIPSTLYQKTWYPKSVSALISMPLGIHKADIDLTEPLIFYPGQIKSQCQFAFEFSWHWKPRTYVWASFDKSACIEHLKPGFNKVNVVGKLTTDRYYDAAGYLKLVPWKWHHRPHQIRH